MHFIIQKLQKGILSGAGPLRPSALSKQVCDSGPVSLVPLRAQRSESVPVRIDSLLQRDWDNNPNTSNILYPLKSQCSFFLVFVKPISCTLP